MATKQSVILAQRAEEREELAAFQNATAPKVYRISKRNFAVWVKDIASMIHEAPKGEYSKEDITHQIESLYLDTVGRATKQELTVLSE